MLFRQHVPSLYHAKLPIQQQQAEHEHFNWINVQMIIIWGSQGHVHVSLSRFALQNHDADTIKLDSNLFPSKCIQSRSSSNCSTDAPFNNHTNYQPRWTNMHSFGTRPLGHSWDTWPCMHSYNTRPCGHSCNTRPRRHSCNTQMERQNSNGFLMNQTAAGVGCWQLREATG